MTNLIYLDHAATTPLRAEARAAMEPFLCDNFANASSVYRLAQGARSALDEARTTVADCLGCHPSEIIFTSGGTESNNAAIKGVAFARQERGRHLVTSAIEHHAVLLPMQELAERFGFEVTVLPVDRGGVVEAERVAAAMRPDTTLVSIMWANNEIGTIQPVEQIGKLTQARGISFHVDAVQSAGTLPIDLSRTPIDLLSISAHKFYGPKGVGALYVRRGTPWWPLLTGGGQERNRRAGTENVAGIVGMARALELACAEHASTNRQVARLRDELIERVCRRIPGTVVNGDSERRLPNNVNFSIAGVHGESLLVGLDLAGIMASSGSACTSGSLEPSHVLGALGLARDQTQASLRLTVGRDNTAEEIARAVEVLERLVARLRRVAPAARGS
ncbi:MAG: cysteine desulfurase [Chloroflexota bacterium]|nr:cysteine desulfurase [Chloroflexota bacterium]